MSKTLRNLREKFRHLAVCESGQDLMEYGLLVMLLALACVSSIQGVANSVNQMFGQVSQAFVAAQSHVGQGTGSGGQGGNGGHHWGGGGGGGHHGGGGGGGHHWR